MAITYIYKTVRINSKFYMETKRVVPAVADALRMQNGYSAEQLPCDIRATELTF